MQKVLTSTLFVLLLLPALLTALLCTPSDPNALFERPNLYRGQQEFAVAMLEAIRKATPNDNVFFSPYSTYHALLLAYFGAGGQTEQELIRTLHLDWAKSKETVRSAYRLEKETREAGVQNSPLTFASADRIYFDQTVPLASCLENRLQNEITQVNFMKQPDECRQQINSWIANVTRNEITEMLAAGDIDASTQLVLANAAYFKGQWVSRFNTKATEQKQFHSSSNKTSFVPMMKQKETFLLTTDETLGAHVVQMPYRTSENPDESSNISMVIILPHFSVGALENVLSKLNAQTLKQSLNDGMPREIEISMPKFEFEQRLELVPILRSMGIKKIFENGADFSDFSTDQDIKFGDAKHVAKIKVDEEGSTASAATAFITFRSARPIEPTKIECNHPFIFLIYDRKSSSILFTGIYRDPKTMKE